MSKSDSNEKATETLRETAQRAEFAKLLNTRSGGTYILLPVYELCRSLRRHLWIIESRVSTTFLGCPSHFYHGYRQSGEHHQYQADHTGANLIRGRGLFARSIMKAQATIYPCFCCACGHHQYEAVSSRRVGVDKDY